MADIKVLDPLQLIFSTAQCLEGGFRMVKEQFPLAGQLNASGRETPKLSSSLLMDLLMAG